MNAATNSIRVMTGACLATCHCVGKRVVTQTLPTSVGESDAMEALTRDYAVKLLNLLPSFGQPLSGLVTDAVNCMLHHPLFSGSAMIPYYIGILFEHIARVYNSTLPMEIKALKLLHYFLSDTYGSVVCNCVPPLLVYYASIGYFKQEHQPEAEKAMKHYYNGGGKPYAIDLSRLIREDGGFKASVEAGITSQGRRSGELKQWVSQTDFSDMNWRNTLGNVKMIKYRITSAVGETPVWVELELIDDYEWHPDDIPRIAPCLHTALENLKHHGARDYKQIGKALVTLTV